MKKRWKFRTISTWIFSISRFYARDTKLLVFLFSYQRCRRLIEYYICYLSTTGYRFCSDQRKAIGTTTYVRPFQTVDESLESRFGNHPFLGGGGKLKTNSMANWIPTHDQNETRARLHFGHNFKLNFRGQLNATIAVIRYSVHGRPIEIHGILRGPCTRNRLHVFRLLVRYLYKNIYWDLSWYFWVSLPRFYGGFVDSKLGL